AAKKCAGKIRCRLHAMDERERFTSQAILLSHLRQRPHSHGRYEQDEPRRPQRGDDFDGGRGRYSGFNAVNPGCHWLCQCRRGKSVTLRATSPQRSCPCTLACVKNDAMATLNAA